MGSQNNCVSAQHTINNKTTMFEKVFVTLCKPKISNSSMFFFGKIILKFVRVLWEDNPSRFEKCEECGKKLSSLNINLHHYIKITHINLTSHDRMIMLPHTTTLKIQVMESFTNSSMFPMIIKNYLLMYRVFQESMIFALSSEFVLRPRTCEDMISIFIHVLKLCSTHFHESLCSSTMQKAEQL